ncbi:hypothetical protein [Nostoc sp. 'Peltigera malacea cyanobiont' DB3992]|nr:hypothetical protein [Nostoc sp. 'Peltigera malacea cyanobiont' DB3992]
MSLDCAFWDGDEVKSQKKRSRFGETLKAIALIEEKCDWYTENKF